MKYRDHRGSLPDSMDTEREINSIEELKIHLNEFYSLFNKYIEEIKFQYAGFDNRIGWNTYYVLQRFKGEIEFTVAGMSDGCLRE